MSTLRHFITTSDSRRRGVWLALFGTDQLPVFAAEPRWQCLAGDWFAAPQYAHAYDLDLQALGETAVDRYAAWVAKRTGREYESVRSELMSVVSVPIKAQNCEVVETAPERPSLFHWFACKRGGGAVRIVNHQLMAIPRCAGIEKITVLTVLWLASRFPTKLFSN